MKQSITHYHLCAIINSEISINKQLYGQTPIRILDMGCGNGNLIAFLQQRLSLLNSQHEFEIYGYDVNDSCIQSESFFDNTILNLKGIDSNIDWTERVVQISSKQQWPYPDNFFDFIISNQVLEHVRDHDFIFIEIWRVLNENGLSMHLFPLKSYFFEGHLSLPFVHWFSNADILYGYIKFCSLLGLGKFRTDKTLGYRKSLEGFCQKHSDYMIYETNYMTKKEIYKLCKKHRLKCSFRYSEDFYLNKLRSIFGKAINYEYKCRNWILHKILFEFLVRISSITLILEKNNTYK